MTASETQPSAPSNNTQKRMNQTEIIENPHFSENRESRLKSEFENYGAIIASSKFDESLE